MLIRFVQEEIGLSETRGFGSGVQKRKPQILVRLVINPIAHHGHAIDVTLRHEEQPGHRGDVSNELAIARPPSGGVRKNAESARSSLDRHDLEKIAPGLRLTAQWIDFD